MSVSSSPRFDASVVWFDAVDSTNAVAARLVASWEDGDRGARSDVLVVAAEQREGRGRGANSWQSPTGGIYASLVTTIDAKALGVVPMAAGVAAAEAAEAVVPAAGVGLKWPNDLIAGGRKLGGLLCQSRSIGGQVVVVVGVGVNLTAPDNGGLSFPATGLRELGWSGDADEAIWSFLAAFEASLRGSLVDPGEARVRWAARSIHSVGDRIRFRWSGGEVEGRFQGFGDDGALVLEVEGEARRFAAGELVGPLGAGGD